MGIEIDGNVKVNGRCWLGERLRRDPPKEVNVEIRLAAAPPGTAASLMNWDDLVSVDLAELSHRSADAITLDGQTAEIMADGALLPPLRVPRLGRRFGGEVCVRIAGVSYPFKNFEIDAPISPADLATLRRMQGHPDAWGEIVDATAWHDRVMLRAPDGAEGGWLVPAACVGEILLALASPNRPLRRRSSPALGFGEPDPPAAAESDGDRLMRLIRDAATS
jgi:hypothetical protein